MSIELDDIDTLTVLYQKHSEALSKISEAGGRIPAGFSLHVRLMDVEMFGEEWIPAKTVIPEVFTRYFHRLEKLGAS